jgi:hypothetical protein
MPATHANNSTTTPAIPRLTDSPWFWANLFCSFGFVLLFLMSPKYHLLQTHVENVYRYGTRSLERPRGATLSDPDGVGETNDSSAERNLKSAQKASESAAADESLDDPNAQPTLISLVPLRIVAGIAMVLTWSGMQWSYQRRKAKARAEQ